MQSNQTRQADPDLRLIAGSPNFYLLPNRRILLPLNLDQDGVKIGIGLFSIDGLDAQGNRNWLIPLATFELPLLTPRLRIVPTSIRGGSHILNCAHTGFMDDPFRPLGSTNMLLISVSKYTFVLPERTFLSHDFTTYRSVPWELWGPSSTRCIRNPLDLCHGTHGERLFLLSRQRDVQDARVNVVLDFNVYGIRRDLSLGLVHGIVHASTDNIISGPSKTNSAGFFAEEFVTALPYRQTRMTFLDVTPQNIRGSLDFMGGNLYLHAEPGSIQVSVPSTLLICHQLIHLYPQPYRTPKYCVYSL